MEVPPRRKLLTEITELVGASALNTVPIAGGPAGMLFSYAMSLPFNRRQERWFESLAQALTDVEERLDGLTFEVLAEDDGFVDTLIAATRAAAATSHEVKLGALRNAVVNAVDAEERPDEELRLRMIRLVDEMVPLHMELLVMLDAPRDWFSRHPDLGLPSFSIGGTRIQVIDAAFPSLAQDPEQRDRLIEDLVVWRLASMPPSGMMTGDGALNSSSTPMGKQFLQYVNNGAGEKPKV